MKNYVFFVFLVLFVMSNAVMLQADDFGKISDEEWQLTTIDEDSAADAVILEDICEMEITNNFNLKIKRRCRIKILTEKGKDYANISIPYWHEDKLRDLKAETFLSPKRKVKVDKKSIFEEKDRSWRQVKFSFPAVEIGSIVEYKYEIYSEYLTFLEPWYFQNEAYTRLSRLVVTIPTGFSYNAFFTNSPMGEREPLREDLKRPGVGNDLVRFTWELNDLPGVQEEPYMTTMKDYRVAIYFQLESFKSPYYYYQYAKNWDDLAKRVQETYDDYLKDNGGLQDWVDEMVPDSLSALEKIEMICNCVKDSIENEDPKGLLSSEFRRPSKVLKEKRGSIVEKNLLLINLLKRAGFKAYPVLISTRSHGAFYIDLPQLHQFNHLIAGIAFGNRTRLFDAGNKYAPYDLLPYEDVNHNGLMVKDAKAEIIPLPPSRKSNVQVCATTANLNADGDLTGRISLRFEGYEASRERAAIAHSEKDKYVDKLIKRHFENAEVDSFEFVSLEDPKVPLAVVINFKITQYGNPAGDMVYLPVPLMTGLKSSPFKRKKRSFAVDYDYACRYVERVEINLPDGFQVAELPAVSRMTGHDLQYDFVPAQDKNKLTIDRQFIRDATRVPPSLYPSLRTFYEKIVGAERGQIVLKQQAETVGEL